MKAAIYEKYGPADVLKVQEVARPETDESGVLVQVFASAVTTADWRMRASAFPGALWLPGRLMTGLLAPKNRILGSAFSGRVVSVGDAVTRFKLGDEVFGFKLGGAHAEYLAVAETDAIARKPGTIGYDEAAAVPFGGQTALVFLRDFAKVAPGRKVLVTGASGDTGVFAVQIAKHLGAEVTGVASSGNVELVRALGADHVIDYTKADFTAGNARYDVVFDTAGVTDYRHARRVLVPAGTYVPLEFAAREMIQSLWARVTGGPKLVIGVSGDTQENLAVLADLLESGAIRPVIDGHYPLERIADAHRRVEGRHKTGAVILTFNQAGAGRQSAA